MPTKEILNDNTGVTANSQQLEILKKNFPQYFDKDGNFIVHKMEEIVGESGLELSKESYSLNWLGKSYARLLANENPRTLLKEDKEHNVKEQNKESQNLLIKGDNLEVLKHLSNAYAESIKMIYIDPPYNTGSDGFIYNDDRKFQPEELSRLAGIDLDEAKRILEFTQSNANSHSSWLTFMYPRLYVARYLLKDDGVIFISIDDNEQAQLKLLCDEIFGEENFIAQIMPIANPGGRDYNQIAVTHEYLLVYAKSDMSILKEVNKKVDFKFNDLDGGFELRELRNRNPKFHSGNRPNLFYPFYVNPNIQDEYGYCAVSLEKKDGYTIEVKPYNSAGKESVWRWGFPKASKNIIDDDTMRSQIVAREKKKGGWNIYEKNRKSTTKVKSIWDETGMRTENGTREIRTLFGETLFSHPKSVELLKKALEISTEDYDYVLDFFAGSGTTAHAVMQLNAENDSNRQFITVQIPEDTDEKSEANKAGYKTIFNITKARIEKAAVEIAKEHPDYKGDLGFKIYETMPVWDGYLDDIEELKENTALFDGSKLNDEELEVLLTTWKVHDGMELSHELSEIDLAGYKGYLADEILYFVHIGFSTNALKDLIEKLDKEKTFEPSRIVLFGYNFASKHQRELGEALSSYANKKSIELDLIVRY